MKWFACLSFVGAMTTAHAHMSVKVGVLTDMSSIYASNGGPGSVESARLAIEDFNPAANGMKVDLVSADHQNKPDVGVTLAKKWFDSDGVAAIFDVPSSAVANAVSEVGAAKNKPVFLAGGVADALTGAFCKPTTAQWVIDTYAMAKAPAESIVKAGGTTWFYIAGDFNAAKALVKDNSEAVKAAGGQVLGSVFSPLDTQDFSSLVLQAQASGAKVIGLGVTGGDLVRVMKQANEFGLTSSGVTLVPLIATITQVDAIGLATAKGARLVTPFYWARDEASREFARRFSQRLNGAHPNEMHAGVYSAVFQYLTTVKALGSSADGKAVMDQMKKAEMNDPLFGKITLAANGRIHNKLMLVEVKTPAESKRPWDYFKIVSAVSDSVAYRPLAETGCKVASATTAEVK